MSEKKRIVIFAGIGAILLVAAIHFIGEHFNTPDPISHNRFEVERHTFEPPPWTMLTDEETEILKFEGDLDNPQSWTVDDVPTIEPGDAWVSIKYRYTCLEQAVAGLRICFQGIICRPTDDGFNDCECKVKLCRGADGAP
jgi:hypothetical protein